MFGYGKLRPAQILRGITPVTCPPGSQAAWREPRSVLDLLCWIRGQKGTPNRVSSNGSHDLTNTEARNWYSIGEAFSRPVSSSDDVSDYAPTQILAEAFRQRWYDGIIYDSGLNKDGKNVALFNLTHADVKERFLYTLYDVSYFFFKYGTGEQAEEASAIEGEQSR